MGGQKDGRMHGRLLRPGPAPEYSDNDWLSIQFGSAVSGSPHLFASHLFAIKSRPLLVPRRGGSRARPIGNEGGGVRGRQKDGRAKRWKDARTAYDAKNSHRGHPREQTPERVIPAQQYLGVWAAISPSGLANRGNQPEVWRRNVTNGVPPDKSSSRSGLGLWLCCAVSSQTLC